MNKINDGGPAFPTGEEHGFNSGAPGMTLRDYFAGQVLPALYSLYVKEAIAKGFSENWAAGLAKDAYCVADTMIAARAADK